MKLFVYLFFFFPTMSLFCISSVQAQIPAEGLVAYYPFNGNADDESGNGNNGVVFGATLAADRFGNSSSSYDFDGIDDHISIGSGQVLEIDGDLTISVWIKPETLPSVNRILPIINRGAWGETGDVNYLYHWYLINIGGATYLGNSHEYSQGINVEVRSTRPVDSGNWIHTALVRNSIEKTYSFFIDGVGEAEASYSIGPTGGTNSEGDIGWVAAGVIDFFNGPIDDVRIYERILSSEEILDLYNESPSDPLAHPGVFYGTTGSSEPNYPGYLMTIDPVTGAGMLVGPTGIPSEEGPSVRALAISSTGEMYAASFEASSDLYSVNASTGEATLIASTGLLRPGDISFDKDDVLYAVDQTDILYTVDVVTGARTVVGSTGVTLGGLAYDPTDGMMYGSGRDDDVYTIDLTTGTATLIGYTGLGGNIPDILFDQDGNLYGSKIGTGGLYDLIAIDKETGAGTSVGSIGYTAVIGLSTRLVYSPPPPDPIAQFGVCYASTGDNEPNYPGALLTIDSATGTGTLIGLTGIIGDNGPAVRALAIKSTGEVYALSHSTSSDLYTVNATSGVGTFVANTGLLQPGDLLFDRNDVLYATDRTNILYTLDEVTGTRTVVGSLDVGIGGLAFDPTNGNMYGSSGSDDAIYTIDQSTGAATLIGNTGFGRPTPDIHFDEAGNLFGAVAQSGGIFNYVSIDKTTGVGTIIGSTGFQAVAGLATRLDPQSIVPCSEIDFFAAKCNNQGAAQALVLLLNSTPYAGEIIELTLDDETYPMTLMTNGTHTIGRLQVPGASFGQHTMTLSDPSGCYDPVVFVCQVNSAKGDTEFDAIWAEYDELFAEQSITQTLPQETKLIGNYPNPFNPSTTFRYALASPGQVSLRVFDMLGQHVRTIVDEHQTEGYHEAVWDGSNEVGATVASGIYIYRMTAGSSNETKRMLLVK